MRKDYLIRMFKDESTSKHDGYTGEYEGMCVMMEDVELLIEKIINGEIPDYDELDRIKAIEEAERQEILKKDPFSGFVSMPYIGGYGVVIFRTPIDGFYFDSKNEA